jgi:carboxyl-terminal processing protease
MSLLLLVFSAFADNDSAAKRNAIITAVSRAIQYQHFDPKPLDDAYSKEVFKLYIQRLDYNKKFFLQADIDLLSKKYQTKLDDAILNQNLDFYNEVMGIFRNRFQEANGFYKDLLTNPFIFEDKEEVVVDGKKLVFAKSKADLKEAWRKALKYQVLNKLQELEETQQKQIEKKDTALKFVKTLIELEIDARQKITKSNADFFDRVSKTSDDDYFTVYVNTLTSVMDPHTDFFPPKDKENFDIRMSGKLEGIGATLQEKDNYIKISSLVIGGPAWKQGQLKADDLIMKAAEGKDAEWFSLENIRVDDAVKHIRGKKGTTVRLYVRHADGTTEEVSIVRDIVVFEDTYAKSSILNYGGKKIGFIYLPEFYADFNNPSGRRCAGDMRAEVEKLKKDQVDGIIIDLRSNGGGSLSDVVQIAGLFIDKGPIVQVKKRQGVPDVMTDPDPNTVYAGPLTIMVNEFSASASEILAAAIQDYHRGIIVGSPSTHGKGTVQRFYDVEQFADNLTEEMRPLGALKMTDQKFYRVNGGSTQLKGVTPDVLIPDNYEYIDYGEKKEDYPLKWTQIPAVTYNVLPMNIQPSELNKKSQARTSSNELFKSVENYAKYLKKQSDENSYSLNYQKNALDEMESKEMSKKIEALAKVEKPMEVVIPSADLAGIQADSNKVTRNTEWRKSLKKDAFIFETVNIMLDMMAADVPKK